MIPAAKLPCGHPEGCIRWSGFPSTEPVQPVTNYCGWCADRQTVHDLENRVLRAENRVAELELILNAETGRLPQDALPFAFTYDPLLKEYRLPRGVVVGRYRTLTGVPGWYWGSPTQDAQICESAWEALRDARDWILGLRAPTPAAATAQRAS